MYMKTENLKRSNTAAGRRPTTTRRFHWTQAFLTAVVAAAVLTACTRFPEPEADNEGHATFSRAVIPILLGRKARGVDEVEVVADIAELHGRATAVEMLMRDPDFNDHWADVLVDLLRVQKEQSGGISVAQDSACWGEPTRENPEPEIAEWVRDQGPQDAGAPTPAWNMTDLLRSAIAIDDLSVVYRANLFPLSMRRAGNAERRAELTSHFMLTYLNRDPGCLKCHNPVSSASNKVDSGNNVIWRRTWTIPGHPEKALFGDYNDPIAAAARVQFIWRGDVRRPGDTLGGGIRPWGMADDCIKDSTSSSASNSGSITHFGFKTTNSNDYPSAGFGSLDGATNPRVSLWELEDSLRQDISELQDGYERIHSSGGPTTPAEQRYCDVRQAFSANCSDCHSPPSPSAGLNLVADDLGPILVNVDTQSGTSTNDKLVVPNNLGDSELVRRLNASGYPPQMPISGGGQAIAPTVETWISNGATSFDSGICVATPNNIPDVDPDEALAFLVAETLVDGIWMSVMGYRLTIDNGYGRNRDQRDALRYLTERTFLPADWSLKSVLTKVLASDWMGRRAPDISHGETAYELPMVLNPWIQADPSVVSNPPPHESGNGMGEMVNRYRINTVLRNVADSLAWSEPRRFPGGGYPSPLDENMGQYLSPSAPGFNGINFQSLLALENETGLCDKSGNAVGSDDWIDALVSEIEAFNLANPNQPLTVGEVWSMLKDRLIQDPTIEQHLPSELAGLPDVATEAEALNALVNEGLGAGVNINSAATELSTSELRGKLREGCGILIKSPWYLLTNLAPRGYSDNNMPDPPRLSVCMAGEQCGYPAICGNWRQTLNAMGKYTVCEDRSVREGSPLLILPWPGRLVFEYVDRRFIEICPPSICGYVVTPRVNPCLRNPELCEKLRPIPPLPVEFSGDIFGQPPVDLHQPGIVALKADGATVRRAEKAMIRNPGKGKWRPLEPGMRLQTGDLIYLPLKGGLALKHEDFSIDTSPIEYKGEEIEGVRAHLISVTGDNAIALIDEIYRKKGVLSLREMMKAESAGTFESRGFDEKAWYRTLGYTALPQHMFVPSAKQVAELNKDFAALHEGMKTPEEQAKEEAAPDEAALKGNAAAE